MFSLIKLALLGCIDPSRTCSWKFPRRESTLMKDAVAVYTWLRRLILKAVVILENCVHTFFEYKKFYTQPNNFLFFRFRRLFFQSGPKKSLRKAPLKRDITTTFNTRQKLDRDQQYWRRKCSSWIWVEHIVSEINSTTRNSELFYGHANFR